MSNRYLVSREAVYVPITDAKRIRYILEKLVEYIDDVGPRDLRGFEDDAKEYIKALPDYNEYEEE